MENSTEIQMQTSSSKVSETLLDLSEMFTYLNGKSFKAILKMNRNISENNNKNA